MSARLSDPRRVLEAADPVAAFAEARRRGADIAVGTSGSARSPRFVVRSAQSWVASFPAVRTLCGLDAGSRVWVPGPVSATMNLFALVLADDTGARVVAAPREATHAFVTPAVLAAHDLSGRAAVVAGDALSPSLAGTATARGVVVHHYYGAAELSFVAWGEHAEALRPFPGVEVEVRDGEIWVRSPYLCTGYDGPPGAMRRDGDGFATVGDRGSFDGERLVVHGRPEAVTSGGTTVLLADVEAALRPHAAGEVVVVAVPHATLGALPAVVLTDDRDREALRDVARSSLTGAHRPRVWFHVERLPLSDTGKVDRTAVAALLRAGRARRLV